MEDGSSLYKTKYRVQNWPDYDRALTKRRDVTVWFDEDAIEAWTPPQTGRRGAQRRYSNLAIVTALTLRVVFRLPLRQTEGFLNSIVRLMDLNLAAPDHTTLPAATGTWTHRSPPGGTAGRST